MTTTVSRDTNVAAILTAIYCFQMQPDESVWCLPPLI